MMPPKDLYHGADAREKILDGVRKLSKMVVVTMGPKGRNVIIERGDRTPIVTKDGVTVAQEIYLKDPVENMGAQIVKAAARKTNDVAGDGTTTATLLSYAIMEEGLEHMLKSEKNAISLKRGIEYAVHALTAHLAKMATPINHEDQYKAIATISAQDERVGDAIASVLKKAGRDGVVTVEAGTGFGLEEVFTEGMQFDNGYLSPYFVTNPEKMECVMDTVPILLTDERIVSVDQILPILNQLGKNGQRKLIIIAESVEGDALATLVVNKIKNNFIAVPVKAPAFGRRRTDMLGDIAALTGGIVISRETGKTLEKVVPEDLGMARKVIISKHQTTILEGAGKRIDIDTRIGEIKNQIAAAEKPNDKEKLQERLAKLAGGVAIIRVGAATEFEQRELQHRVEDALSATKAAVEEGILPGGGVAYIRAVQACEKQVMLDLKEEDERLGAQIVFSALPSCLLAVVQNAGFDAEVVLEDVEKGTGSYGFNANTGKYGDMLEMQVIDPCKVARVALENAASVAGMFLTLEGSISDTPVPAGPDDGEA